MQDVFEVGSASATDAVKRQQRPLKQYLLTYWQPVKHVMKNWSDVLVLASTSDQMDSTIQNNLQSTNDLCRHTI